jgi:signal transduction histidine kinase
VTALPHGEGRRRAARHVIAGLALCAGKKNQFIEVSNYLPLILPLLLSWAAVGTSYGVPIVTREGLAHHSTADLEGYLAALDAELAHLANYSLRSGVGSIGFRSATHDKSDSTEWVQIELGQEQSFDRVVLVPSIRRDARFGFRADGFPVEFRIIAGSSRNPQGKVVGSFGKNDQVLPRVAPFVVECPGSVGSWIRLEATELSPRAWDGKYELNLAEILIFKGEENIALQRPVRASSSESTGARAKRFLVDGSTPFLMAAARGEQSIAMISNINTSDAPTIVMDLETIQPINRIHFHSTDLSDTVPQAMEIDFGIPRRMRALGAKSADFSDQVLLSEHRANSIYDIGPILMLKFRETECRYVMLIADEPYSNPFGREKAAKIGTAEIEIFSNGRNVALGKTVTANFSPNDRVRNLKAITDGRNLYGNILSMRAWLGELARRHDIETERPLIVDALNQRYARQESNLKLMGWLAALLAAGLGLSMLISRHLQNRKIAEIRQRFAADLHDELGANLHTIRLLGDVALNAIDSPERLKNALHRSMELAERSSSAVRQGISLYQDGGLHENLPDDMLRAAERILADVEREISIKGHEILRRLQPRQRADLFLFFKESLVNISRHSGATRFGIDLTASEKEIRMTISDNGRGMTDFENSRVPASLERRAQLLGAQVIAGKSANGGASITLTFTPKRLIAENQQFS